MNLGKSNPTMGFPSLIKYLIPKGVWLERTILLLGFIFLDFLITAVSCRTPYAEANLYARDFMQRYGIVQGLALFNLLFVIPIYAVLVLDSHLIEYTQRYRTKTEFIVDVAFGWLIAGARFNGAMSWLWDAPNTIRQAIGFAVYLAIAIPAFYLFPKRFDYAGSFVAVRKERKEP